MHDHRELLDQLPPRDLLPLHLLLLVSLLHVHVALLQQELDLVRVLVTRVLSHHQLVRSPHVVVHLPLLLDLPPDRVDLLRNVLQQLLLIVKQLLRLVQLLLYHLDLLLWVVLPVLQLRKLLLKDVLCLLVVRQQSQVRTTSVFSNQISQV